mmetsp:Transcript_60627/g.132683  ORF Transcript_60627/g.132683 Transcript_60627/m.132683 type:complete len:80 (+) Transcript_60627:1549-1788(+)
MLSCPTALPILVVFDHFSDLAAPALIPKPATLPQLVLQGGGRQAAAGNCWKESQKKQGKQKRGELASHASGAIDSGMWQ